MTHLHPNRSDDDQIFQKYLDRAIVDINQLTDDMSGCTLCDHDDDFAPVVGTGHPLADIFMLKYAPLQSEIDEGVAFYGPTGDAILRSVQRLNVNPIDLYGTNCIKCAVAPTSCQSEKCPTWLARELSIVSPRILIVMGEDTLEVVNDLGVDDSETLKWTPGAIQQWTPACEALICPSIDLSLHGQAEKQAFWKAFRALGGWYDQRPPW